MSVATREVEQPEGIGELRSLYDAALPEVFGYLLKRCANRTVAEDLTQEVFLAAAQAWRAGTMPPGATGWLIGVARHKLVDHYRRHERERRTLGLVAEQVRFEAVDVGGAALDTARADKVLAGLPATQRLALMLRYADGLAVPEIATQLGRSVHATESVLARARETFRRRYTEVAHV